MNLRLLYIFIFYSFWSFSQDYSDKWEGYFSYNNIKGVAISEDKLLAAAENSVFEHNLLTNINLKTSTIQGLSGAQISSYYFSEIYNTSIIGYDNGLIEVITPEGTLSIVDIINKLSIAPNIKKINHIYELEGLIYLSCDFGITTYNLDDLEFGDTYFIGNSGEVISVRQTTIKDEYIYAATSQGIKRARYEAANIIDFSKWEILNTASNDWKSIVNFNDTIYAINNSNTLFYNYDGNSFINQINISNETLDHVVSNGKMLITSAKNVSAYNPPFNIVNTISMPNDIDASFTVSVLSNDNLYVGTDTNGILNFNFSAGTIIDQILPDGPMENNIFSLATQDSNIWLVYGEYSLFGNPYPLTKKGYSYFKNNEWTNVKYDSFVETLNTDQITDLVSISINPFNSNQYYISSFFSGLVEVINDVPTNLFNNTNSELESLGPFLNPPNPNYIDIRVGKTNFDRNGVLWLTNNRVDNALKSYDVQNNIWNEYSFKDIIADPLNDENLFNDIEIDQNNNKWIGSIKNGVIGVATNNSSFTVKNITDSNGNLPSQIVNALAIDNDNNLWIGTDKGLRVLYNTNGFFTTNNTQTVPIIISENGVPQELMFGQKITDIKVDGANNKWVSTLNAGVFYFSQNGQETIYHFTTNNSPIPSNTIIEMSIDQNSGKIYFVTPKGMVSFNANATASASNFDNVVIQPNPVRPNYQGKVIIKGLVDGANIKITDISGNLVDENTVKGGTYEWDQTAFGKYKVASGVYIVMLTTEDGEESTVEKIMIVR